MNKLKIHLMNSQRINKKFFKVFNSWMHICPLLSLLLYIRTDNIIMIYL